MSSATFSEQLKQIVNQNNIFSDNRIEDVLMLGLQTLKLDIALVGKVSGNEYKIMHYHPLESGLSSGKVFHLKDTYCDITLKHDRLIDIPHMAISKHLHHPCYEVFNLESYIGIPLYLGGVLYGSLSFSSPNAREPFTEAEKAIVKEMADAITDLLQLG